MLNSPYAGLPEAAFWKTGVTPHQGQVPSDLYEPRFLIKPTDKIAVAGSCFAQRVAEALRLSGVEVLDLEPAPEGASKSVRADYNFGVYSARYGNIYTTMHLRQLFEEALGEFDPAEPTWLKGDRYCDAMRPVIEPSGFKEPLEVIEARTDHLAAVREMMETCDVFIFTMGLTEAWIHRDSGTVYPSPPGALAGEYDPDVFELINMTTEQVRTEYERARELILSVNPDCKFVLSVSPQPLTATMTGNHALVANAYTKSTLRAAAGEINAQYDNVDYFPSFELVAMHLGSSAYNENLRTISDETVRTVMNLFLSSALAEPPEDLLSAPEVSERQARRREERKARRDAERAEKRGEERRAKRDAIQSEKRRLKRQAKLAAKKNGKTSAGQPSGDDECEDALLEAFAPSGTE